MTENPCCDEYERMTALSRRRFLGGVAAAGATAVTTNLFGEAVQQASFGETGGNVVVVLSCRGGVDGLGLVVPHGDPAYYTARPGIALPRNSLVCTDAMFGLHPKMAPVKWLWDSGELTAVHAVGMPVVNRSHFAAMEEVEDADPGSSTRQGWVNRMVGLDAPATDVMSLGSAIAPTVIEGPNPSMAAAAVEDLVLRGTENGWKTARRRQLTTTWDQQDGPMGRAARLALDSVARLEAISTARYTPAAKYPTTQPGKDLGEALADSARLIKSGLGVEVITIDFGSWDHHDSYGTTAYGQMQKMVDALARSIDAFMRDLGEQRSRVTLVTISEFGRRVAENGNRGLDHGWGNMMLVAGAGVRGGRYHGTWPGLAAGKLIDGDLAVTTDYRQVLGEVVSKRFPSKDVTQVFPGLSYNPLGVLSGS